MKELYPCLTHIFDNLNLRKMKAYLEYVEGGYYDHPDELFLESLWEDVHDKFDTTLPKDISIWDRYIAHDQLDFKLYQNGLLWNLEYEGSWFVNNFYRPSNSLDELMNEENFYDELEKISPFRTIKENKNEKINTPI
jgi:hypothetical protein